MQRLHDAELLVGLFVLLDLSLYWSEVLLEGHVDVVEQRTLAWQERAGQLETLRMPVLRLSLLLR